MEISAAEKAKLYEAIDYVEDAAIATLPNEVQDEFGAVCLVLFSLLLC